jgi:hypothetical protein
MRPPGKDWISIILSRTTIEAIASILGRPVRPVWSTGQTGYLQNRANGSNYQYEKLENDMKIIYELRTNLGQDVLGTWPGTHELGPHWVDRSDRSGQPVRPIAPSPTLDRESTQNIQ